MEHHLRNGEIQEIDIDSTAYPHLSAFLIVNANKDDDIIEHEKHKVGAKP